MNILVNVKNFLFGSTKRTIIALIVFGLLGYFGWTRFHSSQAQPQYETAKVTRKTLVSSVSESGQVAVANRTSITTQASGVVNNVYVTNGETVTQGQKIADITLDYV